MEAENLFKYFTTLYSGGGSYLGVHCRDSFLGRVESEGEISSSVPHPKGP